jgi:hypothetical protein
MSLQPFSDGAYEEKRVEMCCIKLGGDKSPLQVQGTENLVAHIASKHRAPLLVPNDRRTVTGCLLIKERSPLN